MDLEQLRYLDDDQKARYVKLERTFNTEGWVVIEEWALEKIDAAIKAAASASSWDQHRILTGMRLAFEQVAGLRDSTEKEFLQMAEDNLINSQQEVEEEYE